MKTTPDANTKEQAAKETAAAASTMQGAEETTAASAKEQAAEETAAIDQQGAERKQEHKRKRRINQRMPEQPDGARVQARAHSAAPATRFCPARASSTGSAAQVTQSRVCMLPWQLCARLRIILDSDSFRQKQIAID